MIQKIEETNTQKIDELRSKLTTEQRNMFMYFMYGVLENTINSLSSNSSEMIVLLEELKEKKYIE